MGGRVWRGGGRGGGRAQDKAEQWLQGFSGLKLLTLAMGNLNKKFAIATFNAESQAVACWEEVRRWEWPGKMAKADPVTFCRFS